MEATKNGSRNSGLRPDKGYIGHQAAKLMKRAKAMEARQEKALEEKEALLKNQETVQALKLSPLSYHADRLAAFTGVSACYGGPPVSPPVTFEIRRGERIALSGRNGSGKSSLLKLLTGADMDHTGRLERGAGLIVSYVPQDTSHLTGSLAQLAADSGIDESLFKAVLRKMDFSRTQFEKDMEDFSAGQKKKVLLARSLCQQAHLYLWDEPLNFIDLYSRLQIEALLQSASPTMVFVEHDAAFRQAVATKTIEL